MASRDLFLSREFGDIAGSGTDDVDYWNDPEIFIDPINCMVVAILPRSGSRMPEPPRRAERRRTQPARWRATLARWYRRVRTAVAELPGW